MKNHKTNSRMKRRGLLFLSSSALMLSAIFAPSRSAMALQRTWANTGTDFNATGSWNAAISGNVGAFTSSPTTQPKVSASISVVGLFFNAVSGYDVTSLSTSTALTFTGYGTTATGGETANSTSSAIAASNTSGTNTVDAPVVLAPASGSTSVFFQAAGGTLVVNGAVSGTGVTLELNGGNPGGTVQLTGINSYTGNTLITGGTTLSVASIGDSGSNGNVGAGTTISFGASGNSGKLVYTGSGETTSKIINLAGAAGGATIDQSGTGLLKFTGTNTATGAGIKTLTLQGSTSGSGEISGTLVDNAVGKTTSIAKTGTGTWTLSGANSYSGGTTISDGRLIAGDASALGTGNLTVSGNSTLEVGAGSAPAKLTLNITGAADFSTGRMELTLFSNSSDDNDLLTSTGLLTLTGSTLITVVKSSAFVSAITYGASYNLLDFGSISATGFNVASVSNLALPTLTGGLSWDTSNLLTNGSITAVPEPRQCGIALAGMLIALVIVRRHRKLMQ